MDTQPNKRRHKAPEGECRACDEYRRQGISFHPPHDASQVCPCGCARGAPNERSHCSCDTCF